MWVRMSGIHLCGSNNLKKGMIEKCVKFEGNIRGKGTAFGVELGSIDNLRMVSYSYPFRS